MSDMIYNSIIDGLRPTARKDYNMNVLSLFDGISCGRVALERAGASVSNYYASEIEQSAIIISNSNYPDIIRLGDVTNHKDWKLPKIDLLLGGSPCQGFSRNGAGLNFEDVRSKLFFEYVEILNDLRKQNHDIKFLLENVVMKRDWEEVITETLGVKPVLLNSKIVSAQSRPRLYWTNIEYSAITDRHVELISVLDQVNVSNYVKYEELLIDPDISIKSRELISICDGEIRIKQATKTGYIVADDGDGINLQFPTSTTRRGRVVSKKSPTLDCSCDVCVYHNGVIRKLTVPELERLQTLPAGYTRAVNSSSAKKAIGNGWTVDIIAEILKGV